MILNKGAFRAKVIPLYCTQEHKKTWIDISLEGSRAKPTFLNDCHLLCCCITSRDAVITGSFLQIRQTLDWLYLTKPGGKLLRFSYLSLSTGWRDTGECPVTNVWVCKCGWCKRASQNVKSTWKTELIPGSALSRGSQGQFVYVLATHLQLLCLFP